MKICLVYPNQLKVTKEMRSYFDKEPSLMVPLGILSIIANNPDLDIDFIDNRKGRHSIDHIVDKLKKYDVIGFGGTILEVKQARLLSHILRKMGKKTIYGGPNATTNYNLYIDDFDIIYRGEGELEFKAALETVGVYQAKRINLDNLRPPARYMIELNDYIRADQKYLPGIYPVDTISASRGCPFNCYFCTSKVVWGRKWTVRPVEQIIQEMKMMIAVYNTKAFYFREDNFTANKQFVLKFCEQAKLLNTQWITEATINSLNEDIIRVMADAGCRALWFGIESTIPHLQKHIGKQITTEQIYNVVKWCKKYGIRTGGSFMIGLPYDNKKTILKNIIQSKKFGFDVLHYNRVFAFPGSAMYKEILNADLDDYTKENIIIPRSLFLSFKEINFYAKIAKIRQSRNWIFYIIAKVLKWIH